MLLISLINHIKDEVVELRYATSETNDLIRFSQILDVPSRVRRNDSYMIRVSSLRN